MAATSGEYVLSLYKSMLDSMLINMIWVGAVIIISIVGLVAIRKLKKKEKIKPVVATVLTVILAIVLVAFVCYEGKLLWDYAGVKPAYDYLQSNEIIGE